MYTDLPTLVEKMANHFDMEFDELENLDNDHFRNMAAAMRREKNQLEHGFNPYTTNLLDIANQLKPTEQELIDMLDCAASCGSWTETLEKAEKLIESGWQSYNELRTLLHRAVTDYEQSTQPEPGNPHWSLRSFSDTPGVYLWYDNDDYVGCLVETPDGNWRLTSKLIGRELMFESPSQCATLLTEYYRVCGF